MSYLLGFQAFVKRFEKRFPSPEFRWEVKNEREDENYDLPSLIYTKDFWVHLSKREHGSTSIKIFKDKTEVCSIWAQTSFGIGLHVSSKFLNPPKNKAQLEHDHSHCDSNHHWNIIRRPLHLCFANRLNKRHWLKNKPKFGRLGAILSYQIITNLEKVHE